MAGAIWGRAAFRRPFLLVLLRPEFRRPFLLPCNRWRVWMRLLAGGSRPRTIPSWSPCRMCTMFSLAGFVKVSTWLHDRPNCSSLDWLHRNDQTRSLTYSNPFQEEEEETWYRKDYTKFPHIRGGQAKRFCWRALATRRHIKILNIIRNCDPDSCIDSWSFYIKISFGTSVLWRLTSLIRKLIYQMVDLQTLNEVSRCRLPSDWMDIDCLLVGARFWGSQVQGVRWAGQSCTRRISQEKPNLNRPHCWWVLSRPFSQLVYFGHALKLMTSNYQSISGWLPADTKLAKILTIQRH